MYRRFTQFLNISQRYCYAWISPAIMSSISNNPLTVLECLKDEEDKLPNHAQNMNLVV